MPNSVKPPSTEDDDFRRLMERVQAGCPDAARELYDRYGDSIRRIVRRRLHQRLRTQYDSLDFLQDVWASFFTSGDKYTFEDSQSLINFLASLAHAKVTGAFRRTFQTRMRDVNREQPIENVGPDGEKTQEPPVRGPTPSQEAIANEHWERMLDGQPESCRLMLEMLRQGHTRAEIAERTGLHPKMIQRFLHQMAQRRDIQ